MRKCPLFVSLAILVICFSEFDNCQGAETPISDPTPALIDSIVDSLHVNANVPPPQIEGGARASIGLAFNQRSGFPDPVRTDQKGTMLALQTLYAAGSPHFTLLGGFTFNHSKIFSLYEYPRMQVEWIPGKRDAWFPIFHLSAVYAKVKGYNDPHKFVKKDFGFETGVRIDGPFESFRYSYNTGVGGYHKGDLIFAAMGRVGHFKAGTAYSLYYGKYVRMFGVTMYFETIGDDSPESKRRRPFWHTGFAYLAFVPLFPLMLLGGV